MTNVLDLKLYARFDCRSWRERAFQVAVVVKNPPTNAGDIRDVGSITELGRPPGKGNGSPHQYSCLENIGSKIPKV